MAMAMAMAGKQKKNKILVRTKAQGRLLLFWVVCVCLMGVLYGHIWTLYNPKLPIWPLIGLPDLAGDHNHNQLATCEL
jgi:hypothetical protein